MNASLCSMTGSFDLQWHSGIPVTKPSKIE